MKTYEVNYEYRDDRVASVNMCDGPSRETVKAWYASNGKDVFAIRELTDGEIKEKVDKGMPWTEVPASFIAKENDGRILDVLSEFLEIAECDGEDKLADRIREVMDAINERRV